MSQIVAFGVTHLQMRAALPAAWSGHHMTAVAVATAAAAVWKSAVISHSSTGPCCASAMSPPPAGITHRIFQTMPEVEGNAAA